MSGVQQRGVWVREGEDGAVRGEEAAEPGGAAASSLPVVLRGGETTVNLLNGPGLVQFAFGTARCCTRGGLLFLFARRALVV